MRQMLFILTLVLVTACSPTAAPTPTAIPNETVKLQLSWVHEYSSSPFYAAVKEGYYAERGLTVELEASSFSDASFVDPLDEVLSGESEFAMSSVPAVLAAREAGKAVVAIGSILQRSPLAVISLEESGITRPQDLIGKTVAVSDGSARQIYENLLTSQGIDLSEVNTISRTDFGVDPLLNGEVDAIVAWIINEGVLVEEAGKKANYILMSDYGVDAYDFVIVTSEETLTTRHDMVQRFMQSVTDGIAFVVKDPNKAIEYTLEFGTELDAAAQLRRLEATIPLMNVPGLHHGTMQGEIWQGVHDMLLKEGMLKEPVDLTNVYTLEFVGGEQK